MPQAMASFFHSVWFRRIKYTFWVVYLLIPFFTGLLAYDWEPNESYDPQRHKLLASHEVGDGEDQPFGDHADAWMDRATGAIYTYGDFASHRESESIRMTLAWFSYGLIGCMFIAFVRSKEKQGSFLQTLTIALCVNTVIAAYTFINIRR